MPSSSFPSSDINIWANAVRQLLVENPQQSLAVTTWECSSEGHALHCDYKQHRESRDHDATIKLPCKCLWCFCFFFMLEIFWLLFFVFFFPKQLRSFKLWLAQATFWSWWQKTVALLCHSHSIIAVNISEGRRLLSRFDGGSKSSNDWDCERGIECSNPTDAIKAHKALLKMNISHFRCRCNLYPLYSQTLRPA